MATRGVPAYYNSTRTLSKKFTAKCEANQPLVDKLAEKREKVGTSKFAYTLKRAAESICKEHLPITTFEQIVALKGVGPSIATQLGFSKSFSNPKGRPKTALSTIQSSKSPDSPSSVGSVTSSSVARRQKRKAQAGKPASNLSPVKEKPSRRELAYQKALQESESWKGKRLKWRLVLLIDQRERKAEHYASKVEQCGIPTEIRSLPIGDMCWIAQGFDETQTNVLAELMLGTIIERKEVADLKSSLFGTRYHEQQLRLKDSGQPQVIFLVEGDTKKDLYRCPAETLHSTMWAIRIEKQNQVIQTAHTEETVHTLRRMHRRMLQRTFPSAFYSEALPAFAGPDVAGSRARRQRDSFGEPRRKRRRRLESLHGLIFDEDPIPMAGMPRFVSYNELKAKVDRDREAGRRTIGSIHQGMLKQVATISDTKILPISSEYPTPCALLQAYSNTTSHSERKRLLEGLDTSGNTVKVNRKTLGPRSAEEMYIAYGLDESRRDSINSTTSVVSNAARVASMQTESFQEEDADDSQKALASSQLSKNTEAIGKISASQVPVAMSRRKEDNASKPFAKGIAGLKAKSAKAKFADTVDLLSSDDEPEFSLDVATKARSKLRRASSFSSEPWPGGHDFASGLQSSKPAAKSRSTLSLSLDSSDDELNEILQGISKKKAEKSQTVIAID